MAVIREHSVLVGASSGQGPARSKASVTDLVRAGTTLSPGEEGRRRPSLAALLVTGCLVVGGVAHAPLLAEVLTTTAIAATFDPAVRLPSGSLRAVGAGVDQLVTRLDGASAWTSWEAYVARGVAANLKPAFVHSVITSFAAAGYFEDSRESRTVQGANGTETQTKVVFVDSGGASRHVLYVIESGDEVAWLIGTAR